MHYFDVILLNDVIWAFGPKVTRQVTYLEMGGPALCSLTFIAEKHNIIRTLYTKHSDDLVLVIKEHKHCRLLFLFYVLFRKRENDMLYYISNVDLLEIIFVHYGPCKH